jgi:hypothetical protein
MNIKWVILLAVLSALCAGTGCQRAMTTSQGPAGQSAANVINQNSKHLMALPDVVGVYEGLMPDGKTHCIKVMLSKSNAATMKQLPSSLGDYPVLVEVTGEVRPLTR